MKVTKYELKENNDGGIDLTYWTSDGEKYSGGYLENFPCKQDAKSHLDIEVLRSFGQYLLGNKIDKLNKEGK